MTWDAKARAVVTSPRSGKTRRHRPMPDAPRTASRGRRTRVAEGIYTVKVIGEVTWAARTFSAVGR